MSSSIRIDSDGIIRNVQPAANLPDISVGQYLLDKLTQRSKQTIFIDADNDQEWTAEQFKLEIFKVIPALQAAGIREGQVVGLYAPNSIQHAAIQIACYVVGAIYAGCYWFQTEHEFRQILSSCPFDIVICCKANHEVTKKVATDLNIRTVINIEDESYERFIEASKNVEPITLPVKLSKSSKDAIASILFSSGSTGPPKAAVRTHKNLLAWCVNAEKFVHSFGREGERFTLPMAYCHMSGMYGLLATLSEGLVAITTNNIDEMVKTIVKYKPKLVPLVPSILVTMVKNNIQEKFDLSSVKHIVTAGATLPKYIIGSAQVLKLDNLRQFYGMSECGMVISQPIDKVKSDSIGHLAPGFEAKIVDPETGKTLGPDEVGELLVRGPEVMPYYLNNEKATRDNFTDDGFLKTGDAIKFDREGQFYMVDRYKEVMKVEGKQVAPAELETLLLTHPAVQEVVVVAKEDPVKGQIPRAFIKLKAGHEPSDQLNKDILDHVHSQIIFWKHIYGGIEFLPEIPKIGIGKANRVLLKKRANNIE